jgi:hypothetical protein
MSKTYQELVTTIGAFKKDLQRHLPALQQEVNALIKRKETNIKSIEYLLDTLFSLTYMGLGDNLFIKLLEYYKTVHSENAAWYWNKYDTRED